MFIIVFGFQSQRNGKSVISCNKMTNEKGKTIRFASIIEAQNFWENWKLENSKLGIFPRQNEFKVKIIKTKGTSGKIKFLGR